VPVVTVAHELYYGRHEGWKVQPFGWVQRYGLLPLIWGSHKVVLTVPDRLRRMAEVFPRWRAKLAVMPVGANLAPASGVDRAAWRAGLGLGPDTLVLLHLGLAHPSKRTDDLAMSLDALEAADIPARLVMAGGGAIAHPHAIDVGFLSEEAAATALAAADMAVLPLSEGASARRTSLMNALAAGLPVVSTFGVNTDRALFPPEALTLVPADDPAAFASAVVELARDPEGRERLGAAGRALYEARFSWAVLGPQWRRLLAEAAE
jgi:glycosyltransferase involved in cell wall biosynthesis